MPPAQVSGLSSSAGFFLQVVFVSRRGAGAQRLKRWLKRIAPERRALADVIDRLIPKK